MLQRLYIAVCNAAHCERGGHSPSSSHAVPCQQCCRQLDLLTYVKGHAALQVQAVRVRRGPCAALEETCASYSRWLTTPSQLDAAARVSGLPMPGEPQFMAGPSMAGPRQPLAMSSASVQAAPCMFFLRTGPLHDLSAAALVPGPSTAGICMSMQDNPSVSCSSWGWMSSPAWLAFRRAPFFETLLQVPLETQACDLKGRGPFTRCMSCISGPQVRQLSLGTGVRHCSIWRVVSKLQQKAADSRSLSGALRGEQAADLVLHARSSPCTRLLSAWSQSVVACL